MSDETKNQVIDKRYDFVLLFDVQDGNPNGDPDAGNLPRVDPDTGHGLVTDVCIKRKVRNYVLAKHGGTRPYEIYVMERAVLNQQHARAYEAREITLASPVEGPIPENVPERASLIGCLPEGFEAAEGDEEGTYVGKYDGSLDKAELKEALKRIKEQFEKQAHDYFKELASKTKSRKASAEERESVRDWMCDNFFDIRCFGAVMTTKVNAGQVRGPVQFTFARSIDPIVSLEHSITRMAVATEEEAAKQHGDNRTMGRKATVPYALYRAHGFVSPGSAERVAGRKVQGTGFTKGDLDLLWEALVSMFEHDRSAARGLMTTRALIIFEHDSKLGDERASALFDRVRVNRRDPSKPARSFDDYGVAVDSEELKEVRKSVAVRAPDAG